MPFKINAQSIGAFADEKLSHQASLQNDVRELAAFYKSLASFSANATDPDELKIEVQGLVTKTLSASRRLINSETCDAINIATFLALDRFALVHFASVQHAFLSMTERLIMSIETAVETQETHPKSIKPARPRQVIQDNRRAIESAQIIEIPYTIAVDPASQLNAYFKEATESLMAILTAGKIEWRLSEPLSKFIEIAKNEYVAWAGEGSVAAQTIRSFLNYDHQAEQKNNILDNVNGLSAALENWLKVDNTIERRKDRWQSYRATLQTLPDDKSTMFDEEFGVRKVFIQPTAQYRVAGVRRETVANVFDVASLLGSLVSDRTQSEDLILLCGGPGSGKSTFCRVLASELAANEKVHPVFLRLRRLNESQEVAGFIESQLQQAGLIDKLADLADIPNLVLILDGFDELVMASRSRLREFFNLLKDDLSTGPLRHAKAIVSGRDTLFPNSAGLPIGAHVVSLMPFDRPRIAAWGEKWREMHPSEEGNEFYPENLVPSEKRTKQSSPLEHLVSWPLTLHLVARAHTSGSINLNPKNAEQFEKAVLYRSIVADTALRQEHQATGRGRLDPSQMRRFVQAIAWEMYSSGREALDVSEGLPILKAILPHATDSDLAELADVTIVNQPELTKGEETGFEFVHKSFSEYFAAEQIATGIERVCFQSEQWGVSEKTWQMSVQEGTRLLGSLFAVRLLTAEVQEMLEPMLDDFKSFLDDISSKLSSNDLTSATNANLKRKLERFESLATSFSGGSLLEAITNVAYSNRPPINPLEAFGNYASGLLFVAGALIKRLRRTEDSSSKTYISLKPAVLFRLIHIVLSGDIQIDSSYAQRGLDSIDLQGQDKELVELQFPPISPTLLSGIRGLALPIVDAVSTLQEEISATEVENIILSIIIELSGEPSDILLRRRHMNFEYRSRHDRNLMEYFQRQFTPSNWHRARAPRNQLSWRMGETFDYLLRSRALDLSPQRLEEIRRQLDEMTYRVASPAHREQYHYVQRFLKNLIERNGFKPV